MKPVKDNNTREGKGQDNTKEIKVFSGYELPNYYNVPEHQRFIDCAHKSQKIVTAIYMITDLVPEGDPLVQQLRSHAVGVMNKLYSLTALPQAQRVQELSETSTLIYGLSSYLQVLHNSAKVSTMNYNLIAHELATLQDTINVLLTKNLPYDRQQRSSQLINEFSFSDDFFQTSSDTPRSSSIVKDSNRFTQRTVKDDSKNEDESVKDTVEDLLKDKSVPVKSEAGNTENSSSSKKSFEAKKVTSSYQPKATTSTSKGQSSSKTKATKELRQENILKILKQKKDAKITDITSLITDCGSKTIQRDLTDLVDQGLVTKEGDRRWSVYNLAY